MSASLFSVILQIYQISYSKTLDLALGEQGCKTHVSFFYKYPVSKSWQLQVLTRFVQSVFYLYRSIPIYGQPSGMGLEVNLPSSAFSMQNLNFNWVKILIPILRLFCANLTLNNHYKNYWFNGTVFGIISIRIYQLGYM